MKYKGDMQKNISICLFIVYLIILTWIIVFKLQFSIGDLSGHRSINLIPFYESMIVNNRLDVSEIIENIFVFIPFGVYISMIKENSSFLKKVIPIACTSLFYEIVQFVLDIGASDITDFITNTFGGIIGIIIYLIIYAIFKNKMKINKVINVIAIIGSTFVITILGFLIAANC